MSEKFGHASLPAATIVYHPQLERIGDRVLFSAKPGAQTKFSRLEPLFYKPEGGEGKPAGDPYISRKPLQIKTINRNTLELDPSGCGSKVHLNGEPLHGVTRINLEESTPFILELAGRMQVLLHNYSPPPFAPKSHFDIIGHSDAVAKLRAEIAAAADVDVPVLIRGASGSGKELVAQAIHGRSARAKKGRLVDVNMAALPTELAPSELFGAERGAYTGAHSERTGFFRSAHGGTLFMDEIGEAPPELQVMLLRALETKTFYPVGGRQAITVDVRVIAATDADLEAMVERGAFRAPLLYRLNGLQIRVPTLAERRDDIPRLFRHFLEEEMGLLGEDRRFKEFSGHADQFIPPSFMHALVTAPWPGNVRQLRNFTRRLCVASRGMSHIHIDRELMAELSPQDSRPPAKPNRPILRKRSDLDELTTEHVAEVLARHDFELKSSAHALGISRPSLYKLIRTREGLHTIDDLNDETILAAKQNWGDLVTTAAELKVGVQALKRRLKQIQGHE